MDLYYKIKKVIDKIWIENDIRDEGMTKICEVMKTNGTITELNLSCD